jgi:hypothetical protein
MSLSYCQACQSLEGRTRLATADEVNKTFGEALASDDEVEDVWPDNYVCEECGSVGELTGVPEHDDYDMER